MKYLIKSSILPAMLAAAYITMPAAHATEASATEAASPHTLTSNIGFFTDYTYRGISLARERGAVQGGIDYSHSSGFFLGAWATNVEKNAFYENTVELDIYGGYVHQLADDLSMNVGFLSYYYPDGNRPGAGTGSVGATPNTTELNAAMTYKYFTLKHSASVTDYFGNDFAGSGSSRGSGYTEFNVNYKLPVADLNLVAHVGRLSVRNYSELNYTDWLVGVNKDFSIAGSKGWNAGVNYTTTNADDNLYVDLKGWETGNDRLIGYVKRTF
jgi:uncharacterized protein (TIGR02001 family)